jgi:2-oxoglutarate dehydrogenase E1 component
VCVGGDVSNDLIREFSESSQLGSNAGYVDGLYEAWLDHAEAVPADWRRYFEGLPGRTDGDVPHAAVIARIEAAQRRRDRAGATTTGDDAHARKQAGVLRLLTAYRSRGHLGADLDPLGLAEKHPAPHLELAFHGLSDADLDP